MIILHVIIALISIVLASTIVVRPSRQLLAANYAFIAATVVTGTYLIVTMPAHMLSACITGVTYLAIATTLTIVGHVRIAHLKTARR